MKVLSALLSTAAMMVVFCELHASSLLNELNASQTAEVMAGGQVVLMDEIAGKPWPKVRLYQKIKATSEEVIAVFFDYKNAKTYVPKILKSDISKRVSPCVIEVDYGVDIPILPDEYYTVRNTLQANTGDAYRVDWTLLRALQTKASEGSLRVEPTDGGAVVCYTNLVTPGSAMAPLLRGKAIEQMRNTVHAIVHQVETQKTSHPEALAAQVAALKKALLDEYH